ncbi:hypothetical protein [Aquamicrobium terrae]
MKKRIGSRLAAFGKSDAQTQGSPDAPEETGDPALCCHETMHRPP